MLSRQEISYEMVIRCFSLFVMLLIGLAVAPSFFDWNKYKEPILQQVAELTGHNVRIEGDISLALLPSPRVFLADDGA